MDKWFFAIELKENDEGYPELEFSTFAPVDKAPFVTSVLAFPNTEEGAMNSLKDLAIQILKRAGERDNDYSFINEIIIGNNVDNDAKEA